jgi:hypothetical protein
MDKVHENQGQIGWKSKPLKNKVQNEQNKTLTVSEKSNSKLKAKLIEKVIVSKVKIIFDSRFSIYTCYT